MTTAEHSTETHDVRGLRISVYDLKPHFQTRLRPIVGVLADAGFTPNHLTIAGAIVSVVAGACLVWRPTSRWPLLIVPAALFVRMALNALDGMMARSLHLESRLGAM